MEVATLEAIVDNSRFVKNEVVLGSQKAKNELQECLPIEREQFAELAENKTTDFMNGYDDKYPRIEMNVVENSTKMMNGQLVPAFAIYNVNSQNAEYTKQFKIDNIDRYENQREIDKKMVPHSPLKMKLANHFYRNCTDRDVGGVIAVGLVCQFANFLWREENIGFHIFASFAVSLGAFMMVYGLGIFNWQSGFEKTRKFTHKFSGVIPKDVRDLVRKEIIRFDQILLIEEAHSWKINDETVNIPKNLDPLIVGKKDNKYFLLAKFDVTPLENLLATEYSA